MMGDPHPILQGPLIAIAQEADQPPGPWHLGGPTPELSPAATVRTAIACAERVSEHVPASERAAFDGILTVLRRSRRLSRDLEAITETSEQNENESSALSAARNAAEAASYLGVRKPDGSLAHGTAGSGANIYRGGRLPRDLLGDYFYGEVVGRVRSAAYGFTVQRNVALAKLPSELGVGAEVEVDVMGELVPATVAPTDLLP